jgi:hypothetical protein
MLTHLQEHAHTHPYKQCHLKTGHLEFSVVVLYWCFTCLTDALLVFSVLVLYWCFTCFTDALLEFSVLVLYWCCTCFADALLYCGITLTHTHTHNSLSLSHTHTHTHTEPPDDGDPCAICFEIQPGDEWCESIYIAPHKALSYLCMRP